MSNAFVSRLSEQNLLRGSDYGQHNDKDEHLISLSDRSEAESSANGQHSSNVVQDQGGEAESSSWGVVQRRRGRTNRRRSSVPQSYVCVVVWLVKPTKDDMKATQLVWDKVQDIRRRYDQAYSRWEPHVTLIPPFIVPFQQQQQQQQQQNDTDEQQQPVSQMKDAHAILRSLSKRIENICQLFTSQSITFDDVDKFSLRRYDTFHLRPQANATGTETLKNLQETLAYHLPETSAFSRNSQAATKFRRQTSNRTSLSSTYNNKIESGEEGKASPQTRKSDYEPHLTLGQASQATKAAEIQALANRLVAKSVNMGETGPLCVSLDSIQLMFKPVNQTGPYDVFQSFKLRSTPAQKAD